MSHSLRIAVVLIAGLVGFGATAQAQSDPPGRVGRLAFIDGSVSFHDDQETGWSPAVVNTPLTSGDAVWTEPNARSELSVAGTRVRMDSSTQLDMLVIDDSQTRLQIDRGRIDIKTFTLDTRTPYPGRHAARHDHPAAAGRLLRRGWLDRGRDASRRPLRRRADPEPERPGARRTAWRSRRDLR